MLTYDPMNIEMYNIHMDLYSAAEGVLLEIGILAELLVRSSIQQEICVMPTIR